MKADNFALTHPHPSAIYLPALQHTYIINAQEGLTPNRPLPDGFDLADTAFWTGNSKLFNHKYCLSSVGSYTVGSLPKNTLFDPTRGDFTLVGDSGGYQLGTGAFAGLRNLRAGITGLQAVAGWRENYAVKHWLITTLNTYFDYSMTIDMALWFNSNFAKNSVFNNCSDDQLIAMTLDNLRLIEDEGLGRTKWLNVLQGTNLQNTITWWNAVKHFKHGGWSLAGAAGWRGGLHNMLTLLLTMRDENAFDAGQDWLHMLGVSQPLWHMYFTACQNILRKQSGNHNLQFSYDSASAFIAGGKTDEFAHVPALEADEKSWGVQYEKLDAVRSNASSTALAFPENTSPLGQMIEMRHLVIKDAEFEARRIDAISNHLMVCHNIWVYLDAGRRMHDVAFNANGNRSRVPQRFGDALQVLEHAFDAENWRSYLDTNKTLLDGVAALQER